MEWSESNFYNSFNSLAKGLSYYEYYQSINDWRLGKIKAPMAPVEISLDPISSCQLLCQHCNFSKYLQNNKIDRLTDEHYLNLIKFFVKWGCRAICFTGDTKIKLVDGSIKTFKELIKKWDKNKQPFEVYSRYEKGNIVHGIANEPRETQKVTELIEIILNNNKIIKCTPNHKFMLKDGSYKEAKDLTIDDSLMPLYTKLTGKYEFIKDYTYQGTAHKLFSVYWNGNKNRLEKRELVVHHKNYNKYRTNGYLGWEKAQKYIYYNHRIISKKIIKLNKPISVYSLTVEKYHNFALEAGVFVKNCHGGGGEPTLHTKLWDALLLANKLGLENSIATNGINFNDKTIEVSVKTCRWIGVSVDSSNTKTYKIGRKADYFNKVIENIKKLSQKSKELKCNCDISFKFLVFSYNQKEIYDACKLAKSLGVRDFHARIADYRHQGMKEWKTKQKFYNIKLIKKQFDLCRKLETKDFRIFCITHKFNEDFTPKRNFNQCYASSLCLQVNPNNNCYLCPDTRNLEYYKLGEHYPNPKQILKFWGSQKHYNLVFNSGCDYCVSRCTFNPYNKMFEDLFINQFDPLCRSFV